jgi:hypothetical protein
VCCLLTLLGTSKNQSAAKTKQERGRGHSLKKSHFESKKHNIILNKYMNIMVIQVNGELFGWMCFLSLPLAPGYVLPAHPGGDE